MPLVIFLLGICLVSLIVYITDTHENEQRHITAQLNATTYGERIKNEFTDGIEITDDLKQILISENGEIRQFETIAENLMSDSIESVFPSDVLLGRNGVMNSVFFYQIVPLKKRMYSYSNSPNFPKHSAYPTFASDRSQLMRCADVALYEINILKYQINYRFFNQLYGRISSQYPSGSTMK